MGEKVSRLMVGGPAHGKTINVEVGRTYLEWAEEKTLERVQYIANYFRRNDGSLVPVMIWGGVVGDQDALRRLAIDFMKQLQ